MPRPANYRLGRRFFDFGGHGRHDHQDSREPHSHDRGHSERDLLGRGARCARARRPRRERGTLFDPPAERLDIAPRKLWIALGDKAHGSVTVDDGAAKALVSRGSSLLAVGIREVDGQFAEGDVLDVCDPSGMVVARGIAEADSDVLELAAGRRQDQIASNRLLANLAEKPAIHRDNLIVFA